MLSAAIARERASSASAARSRDRAREAASLARWELRSERARAGKARGGWQAAGPLAVGEGVDPEEELALERGDRSRATAIRILREAAAAGDARTAEAHASANGGISGGGARPGFPSVTPPRRAGSGGGDGGTPSYMRPLRGGGAPASFGASLESGFVAAGTGPGGRGAMVSPLRGSGGRFPITAFNRRACPDPLKRPGSAPCGSRGDSAAHAAAAFFAPPPAPQPHTHLPAQRTVAAHANPNPAA